MTGLPYFWEHVNKSITFHYTSRSQRAVAVASILSRSARMMQFGSLALLLSRPSELDAKNVSSPSVFVYWSNHGCYLVILWKNATWTPFHIISPFFSCKHSVASSNDSALYTGALSIYQLYDQESLIFCWKFQSDHYPQSRWYLVSGRAVQFVARWWSSEASLPLPWGDSKRPK